MKRIIFTVAGMLLSLSLLVSCGPKDVASDIDISDVSSNEESDILVSSEEQVSSEQPTSSVSSVVSDTPVEPSDPPSTIISFDDVVGDDDAAPSTMSIDGKTYNLSFEDNFLGDSYDSTKWRCQEENRGVCAWDEDSVEVANGCLRLWAVLDDDDKVLCGELQSLYTQKYGYFEAKIWLPKPPRNFWGAFWIMAGSVGSPVEGGINGTEIDIMESIPNKQFKIQHNFHWDGYDKDHKSTGERYSDLGLNLYSGWHTYGLLWTETEYKLYIDGNLSWEVNPDDYDGMLGTCNQPGYMLLSMEAGSAAGNVIPSHLPTSMLVDWVRAYQ